MIPQLPPLNLGTVAEEVSLALAGLEQRQQAIATYREQLAQQPEAVAIHAKLVTALTLNNQKAEARHHLFQTRAEWIAAGRFDLAGQLTALLNSMSGAMVEKGAG